MYERLLHVPIQRLSIALGQATSAGTEENFTSGTGNCLRFRRNYRIPCERPASIPQYLKDRIATVKVYFAFAFWSSKM